MFKIIRKSLILVLISIFMLGNQAVVIAGVALDGTTANAVIDISVPNITNINVSSANTFDHYSQLSSAVNEAINVIQPGGSDSQYMFRVTGVNPSELLGTLTATGQIFIINPNGVMFGQNATLDVGGLVASTLDISGTDFMNKNYVFSGSGTGSVVNYADLSTAGGYIVLLGNQVRNYGSVISNLGTVVLAGGEKITLGLDSGDLISVVVNEKVTQNLTSAAAAVENFGTLKADGGKVIVTAKTLDTVFDQAINNAGVIEAKSLSGQGGQISLLADEDIVVAGRIEADGDIDIASTNGDVIHQLSWVEGKLQGVVDTNGGNFSGNSGGDYILRNGTVIETDGGAFNIAHGGELIIGTETSDILTSFDWDYKEGDRGYKFIEFGYYDENGNFTSLTSGSDIGKDGFARLSGDGSVYGEGVNLYARFITHTGSENKIYSDPAMNVGGQTLVKLDGTTLKWEDDPFNIWPGNPSFDDAVFNFLAQRHVVSSKPIIPPTPDGRGYGDEYQEEFPVYYEILSPSQFLSFEPATSIGLYAYHPLTPVDQSAFDDIRLDVDAYEFIDNNIKKKKSSPYFGE